MQELAATLKENVDFLMSRILDYAIEHDFTKYTSTLEEAWRLSIDGLNRSISYAISKYDEIPELTPDEDYTGDPLAEFGMHEAKMHRNRGIPLSMFLGLYKYYKQTYRDLIDDVFAEDDKLENYLLFIERCFDRIEIAYVAEWSGLDHNKQLLELQDSSRRLINEKNAYLTVFESFHDPVILLNENAEIENMNFAGSKLLYLKEKPGNIYYSNHSDIADGVKKKNIFDVVPEFNGAVLFDRNSEKQEFKSIEIVRNGKKSYYNILCSTMLDFSKKFSGYLIICRDVTPDLISNKALKESERRFRTLVGNIPGAVFRSMLVKGSLRTVFISEGIYDINGHRARDIMMGNVNFERESIFKEDLQQYQSTLIEMLETGQSYNLEYRIKTKSDETKWIMERGSGHQLVNGDWIIDGVIFDITEQKEREKEINYFFDHSMDMLCIAGFDGFFKKLSPAWEKKLGWSMDELLSSSFYDFVTDEYKSVTKTLIDSISIGTTIQDFENQFICKDGTKKWLAWSASSSIEEKRIYAVARDISERKKLELELLTINNELELRVEERTLEIESMNKKLEHALEKEHDLAKMQSQFINMISHEYRTPLTSLTISSELLKKCIETDDFEKMNKISSMMNSSISALNILVSNVLDFSRVSNNTVELSINRFEIKKLVRDTISEIEVMFDLQNIIMLQECDFTQEVLSDAKLVRLIISELLLNAVKYSDYNKEVVVNLEIKESRINIIIDDLGVGIRAEDKGMLFSPFYKGRESIGIRQGSGLGLSTALKYANLLKGDIYYENREPQGSRFVLELPV